MTRVIDSEGRLFGRVNVIDVFFVGLVTGAVLAAVGYYTGGFGFGTAASTTVVLRATVPPYVADAIPTGEVGTEDVARVERVEVVDRLRIWHDGNPPETLHAVDIHATLPTATQEDRPHYRDARLYVGRALRGVDFETTIIDVRVAAIGETREVSA